MFPKYLTNTVFHNQDLLLAIHCENNHESMDGYFPVDSGRQKYGFSEVFLLGQSFIKLP